MGSGESGEGEFFEGSRILTRKLGGAKDGKQTIERVLGIGDCRFMDPWK
ncbi:MAG: hypothetical protein ACE144_06630 [Thermodesulfobacteriota bacterium]